MAFFKCFSEDFKELKVFYNTQYLHSKMYSSKLQYHKKNQLFSCSYRKYCLPLHSNTAKTAVGFILFKVGCLGGGGGATLLENNNKRLLLFGILLNLPHSKESNPKE